MRRPRMTELILALVNAVILILNKKLNLGLSNETLALLTGVVVAYIGGRSLVKYGENRDTPVEYNGE